MTSPSPLPLTDRLTGGARSLFGGVRVAAGPGSGPGSGPEPESASRTGEPPRPRWERPALWGLLAVAAALYLWSLGSSGYANSFYSAAAQAGSQSWKAFLFGSLDSANAITVDKPPAALWPMALSVRLFGLGSWQILVPQALMGVATVAVLYAAVRRRFGAAAGLIAGAVLALTPVATLMFRFNNPDALLTLLMVGALYFTQRALEDARTKWLVYAGLCLGLGFLTKTLQAWLIVPVLALVYGVCAPVRLRRRLGQLLLGGVAAVLSGGWWVALAELWPAGSRPYIGGSQSNSFLELTLGYNGLGRITGDETGSVGGAPGGGGPGGRGGGGWGGTGIGRLFNDSMGGQISWLLPAALILLVAGLVLTRRAVPQADAERSALLVWGGSLLITGAVFSFMSGIFHEYYNIALAPYVAAVVAMGAVLLWRRRTHLAAAATLALTVAATAVWSYVLLDRSADWLPWLRWVVLVGGAVAAFGLLALAALPRVLGAVVVAAAVAASLAGPVAYTLSTVRTPHTGSIVTAGPASARSGPGGFPGGRMLRAPGGKQGRQGGMPGMRRPAGQGQAPGRQNQQNQQNQQGPRGGKGMPGMPGAPGGARGGERVGGPGGMGGLLGGQQVSAEAKAALRKDAADYTWAAAAIGSQNAASFQLATGRPVMAIGGFNGSDPYPTLAQFKRYVREGKIHYFLAGEQAGPGGDRGSAAKLSSWVAEHYTKVKHGDSTFYDLTRPKEAKDTKS